MFSAWWNIYIISYYSIYNHCQILEKFYQYYEQKKKSFSFTSVSLDVTCTLWLKGKAVVPHLKSLLSPVWAKGHTTFSHLLFLMFCGERKNGGKSVCKGIMCVCVCVRVWFVKCGVYHACQPIQFTSIKIKIQFFHYFGGIWPHWKMDTGKHNFHEILLLF